MLALTPSLCNTTIALQLVAASMTRYHLWNFQEEGLDLTWQRKLSRESLWPAQQFLCLPTQLGKCSVHAKPFSVSYTFFAAM